MRRHEIDSAEDLAVLREQGRDLAQRLRSVAIDLMDAVEEWVRTSVQNRRWTPATSTSRPDLHDHDHPHPH